MASMARRNLNRREKAFVRFAKTSKNYTDAAEKAGYPSEHRGSLRNTAYRLSNDPRIRAELAKHEAKLSDKADVKVVEVVRELYNILMADPLWAHDENGCVLPIDEWPEDLRRALAGIEVHEVWSTVKKTRRQTGRVVKMKFWSKTASSDQLLKKLGAFTDKHLNKAVESVADALNEIKARRAKK
jgi:phage terminase small subunit